MSDLKITKEESIIKIEINRPKALNAINRAIMKGLNDFFTKDFKEYGEIHGVILTGVGEKAFAAGADITEFSSLTKGETAEMSLFGHSTNFSIEQFHVPVIGVINGFALGGGCELAMACHMRIATSTAKFGQPEVNLGLLPGYGGTQRLVQLIGLPKAIEYLLTGNMINAQTALELGLVNAVYEGEQAMEEAVKLINLIGSKGPLAVAETLKAVYAGIHNSKDGYEYEADAFGRVMVSDEAKEGTSAFLEKRKANFRN